MQAESKAAIRKRLLTRRRALSADEIREKSLRILDNVCSLTAWTTARRILLYLPINGEVDTWPLLRTVWAEHRTALLPCCRSGEPGIMDIFEVQNEEQVKPGYCGIPEPDRSCCRLVEECIPDLAVIPGVGFDRQGYRLGYGGGYYDRFLAGQRTTRTLLAGLGYGLQLVKALPREPWDMPMDLIITETGILHGAEK
ncbi:MAG TPA: 5-formyltetrahydrofolate cyclo-ligase [Desulfomicrobiaceae bacterium]|nr:5-formyltetrahydrofolate cyclo-ligase [Desulfomicrobiaceae bacterium]